MKFRTIIFLLAVFFSQVRTFAQNNSVFGVWLTEDGKAKVEIGEGDGYVYGKIIWLREPIDNETGQPKLDKKNPDASKRSLPILGSILIWGFKKSNNDYTGGYIYDAREGKTYSSKIWLENSNSLKMRGYWGPFYKTETWTRVTN
jgi:uncharacterized protein (DUF2147 family)